MFANYITSAVRSLMKDRFHAALNIASLAVSLAAALLIALYVRHELSYENFFTDPGSVYRAELIYLNKGQPQVETTGTPYLLMERLNADFALQLEAAHFRLRTVLVEIAGNPSRRKTMVASGNLFDVLDFPVLRGDAGAALRQPGHVILTQAMAKALFGTDDVVGRSLRLDGKADLRVGAVLKDLPRNTDFDFGIVLSEEEPFARLTGGRDNWNAADYFTFLRFKAGTTRQAIAGQLPGFVERQVPPAQMRLSQLSLDLRPLGDVHLHAGDAYALSDHNAIAVKALTGTGVFLVLIACFNYINLATARAIVRRPEVGLRKILGGTTAQLFVQFMSETLMTTLLAFALCLGLAMMFLPVFAAITDRALNFADLLAPGMIAGMVGLLVLVSLLAGAYPALFLASSRPGTLFQKQKGGTAGRSLLRSAMVAIQFSLTVGLVIAAGVVFRQVGYLNTLDLGFNKDRLLLIQAYTGQGDKRVEALRSALAQSPSFSGVTASLTVPDPSLEMNITFSRSGKPEYQDLSALAFFVDDHFLDVYGVKPLAGRGFSSDFGNDAIQWPSGASSAGTPPLHGSILISASAVSYFGFASPGQVIGRELESPEGQPHKSYTIVGVIPDFQLRLGHKAMKPTVFLYAPNMLFAVSARVRGDIPAAIAAAKATWLQIFPDSPFDYRFLEDTITVANADEARQAQLFAFFTGLAIFVACLGLFGLASFVAARRTREVAIRKILGASTAGITRLLLWDFAKPVLLANLIAWPVAWLLMRHWLDGFPYRISLSPTFFLGASALALAVALATVFARTWRAARIRPATALKYE